jgi:CheY-like chemotaxis protein
VAFHLTFEAQGQTVFVVEDDMDFRTALEDVLAQEGLRPVLFATAQKLLGALDDDVPAVIVTDFLMPSVSGAELLAALRENDRWRDIPVVVMTGTNDSALPLRLDAPVVYKPDTDVVRNGDGAGRQGPPLFDRRTLHQGTARGARCQAPPPPQSDADLGRSNVSAILAGIGAPECER